ncbi:hypothetical protein [Wenjunlia tyrosinilytica]|uniref:Uncharacterized protein n=1 Tax=Wenjunlia tyrosinilytica TaxID=1544741 RepID=A0A918E1K1_9ACTN|nr:hypothetical protein [Wenjunlia tyrosinilytica]GGO96407.1 hypothetical protein GCM10012280_55820 [Wenjunlia tyrosinilytica]
MGHTSGGWTEKGAGPPHADPGKTPMGISGPDGMHGSVTQAAFPSGTTAPHAHPDKAPVGPKPHDAGQPPHDPAHTGSSAGPSSALPHSPAIPAPTPQPPSTADGGAFADPDASGSFGPPTDAGAPQGPEGFIDVGGTWIQVMPTEKDAPTSPSSPVKSHEETGQPQPSPSSGTGQPEHAGQAGHSSQAGHAGQTGQAGQTGHEVAGAGFGATAFDFDGGCPDSDGTTGPDTDTAGFTDPDAVAGGFDGFASANPPEMMT